METMKPFDLKAYVQEKQEVVDEALRRCLPPGDGPSARVFEAMRYSVMAGGKRIRPILLMAGAEAVRADPVPLLPFACAIECIHTYSLIHDDLPAMDDDDLRRGVPTCHKAFGEAVAILAGDGLLTLAFEIIANPENQWDLPGDVLMQGIHILARAAGVHGMVGGQTADVLNEGRDVDADTLSFIHTRKTGALIAASVELGGLLGRGRDDEIHGLKTYGRALGLAFQIRDDLLDVEGDERLMGKPIGSDARRRKATYPALFGLEKTRERARELLDAALGALAPFGRGAEPLRAIARFVVERKY